MQKQRAIFILPSVQQMNFIIILLALIWAVVADREVSAPSESQVEVETPPEMGTRQLRVRTAVEAELDRLCRLYDWKDPSLHIPIDEFDLDISIDNLDWEDVRRYCRRRFGKALESVISILHIQYYLFYHISCIVI